MKVKNDLTNQGVQTVRFQYYITHQELILSKIVKESDICNNYSYISYVNWDIEKTHETHPKHLEFNINKPEAGLKKIDVNIIVNDNDINDVKNNKVIHPSDNLTADDYSNIDDHEIQQERTNHNRFYIFVNNQLQSSAHLEDTNKTND